jgi:hypothetical protein
MLGVLAIGVALLGSPLPTRAQALQPWPEATVLSPGSIASLEPQVAYDDEGFAHVVYYGGETQDKWAIYYTNNRGGGWSEPRRISAENGDQRLGGIAAGSDGHLHVVYERRSENEIFYVESPDRGESWGDPQNISRSSGRAFNPSVAVDADNTVHAAWSDTRFAGLVQMAYASRPVGANWGRSVKIGGDLFEDGAVIATSGSGADRRVHIVYSGRPKNSNFNDDFDVYYVTRVGASFVAPRNLSNDRNIWSLVPQIAAADNQLFLVWDRQTRGQHDIVFARSLDAGGTWTEAVNLSRTPFPSLNPSLAVGRDEGRAQVHVVWEEGEEGVRFVPYTRYLPDANSFGPEIEKVNSTGDSYAASVGAAQSISQVAVAFESRTGGRRVYVTNRGTGAAIRARVLINGGAASTTSRTLRAGLSEFAGNPVEMRYAVNREPDEAAPWQPLQADFAVEVPREAACDYTLFVQLRDRAGQRSATLRASILVDSEVQAQVELRNPYYNGSNSLPEYTNRPAFTVRVANAGECGRLTRLSVAGAPQPFAIDNNGFAATLVLPGPLTDGARPVTARVEDSAGNKLAVSRMLTLDTQPPELITGTAAISAPVGGLPTPLATIALSGLVARDNLYEGGYWAALVANAADATVADDDPRLQWRPVALDSARRIVGWNVLTGLASNATDRTWADKPIEVRVKLLDGAGNRSAATMRTTVRLSPDYRAPTVYVPLATR